MAITANELHAKVAERRSLKALKDETENALKAIEMDIANFLKENSIDEYIGNDYKVTYKYQSRTTLDNARLEEDLGDLSTYQKISTFPVLRIT